MKEIVTLVVEHEGITSIPIHKWDWTSILDKINLYGQVKSVEVIGEGETDNNGQIVIYTGYEHAEDGSLQVHDSDSV